MRYTRPRGHWSPFLLRGNWSRFLTGPPLEKWSHFLKGPPRVGVPRRRLQRKGAFHLRIRCILGDIRLWVGNPSTFSCRVSLPQPNLSLSKHPNLHLNAVWRSRSIAMPDITTPKRSRKVQAISHFVPGIDYMVVESQKKIVDV
jgi:hypothetical protein